MAWPTEQVFVHHAGERLPWRQVAVLLDRLGPRLYQWVRLTVMDCHPTATRPSARRRLCGVHRGSRPDPAGGCRTNADDHRLGPVCAELTGSRLAQPRWRVAACQSPLVFYSVNGIITHQRVLLGTIGQLSDHPNDRFTSLNRHLTC